MGHTRDCATPATPLFCIKHIKQGEDPVRTHTIIPNKRNVRVSPKGLTAMHHFA